jgi:hypothetical protein
MGKYVALALFFMLSINCVNAQTISGSVLDSLTNQKLPFATAVVYTAKDSSIHTYRLTDPDGNFKIPDLLLNVKSRLLISFTGYQVFRYDFTVTDPKQNIGLGKIKLLPDSRTLEEILVKTEYPPVVVRKDTIEFNAASFKTLPTAIVEDLFKKLPGVSIDENGNITVNGRRVNRIQVDGRDFFSGDVRMATKNLPANIIDKVQVVTDDDERQLHPELNTDQIGQVINLKIKKYVKKTWFGKLAIGAGTDDKFETSGIVNLFRDTLQVSILGFANNTNKAAFGYSDLTSLGGFRRSGINNISIADGGGITLNNISFGGVGLGLQHTGGGGFNINHDLKKGLTLNFQYFYGATKNDIEQQIDRRQIFGDTVLSTRMAKSGLQNANSHRIASSAKWRINKQVRVEYSPSIAFTNQNSGDFSDFTNSSNMAGKLNRSGNNANSKASEFSYNHTLLYFKSYLKAGRSLSITNSVSSGYVNNDLHSFVLDSFYSVVPPAIELLDQLRIRSQKNTFVSLNLAYTEAISKTVSMRLVYNLLYNKGADNLRTFGKDMQGDFTIAEPSLSNLLGRTSWRNNPSAGFSWRKKDWNISVTGQYLKFDLFNKFAKGIGDLKQQFSYFLPSVSASWKYYSFNYSNSVSPPSITDVQIVPDNTNPIFVLAGNPLIQPTQTRNLSLNFYKYNPKNMLATNIYISSSARKNAVVRERVLDVNGVQISTPININTISDNFILLSVDKQFKRSNEVQFSLRGNISYNFNRGYVSVNKHSSFVAQNELFPVGQFRMNWNDQIEVMVSGSKSFANSRYENPFFTSQSYQILKFYNEFILRWPDNVVLDLNFTYRSNSSVANSVSPSYGLLSGGLTYLFLAQKKGQLKLTVYDILNQNVLLSNYIQENILFNSRVETIKQYFLLSFFYDIRGVKSNKVGGQERLLLF